MRTFFLGGIALVTSLLNAQMSVGLDNWAVVASGKLDARLSNQLSELAKQQGAQVQTFRSAAQAERSRAKLTIELHEEKNRETFLAALKRETSSAAQEPAGELAREGYILEASYPQSSVPNRLRITAADVRGFHDALLRIPDLLRTWPSSLAADLAPPAKSVAVEKGAARVVIADFPSFPVRGIVEGFYGTPWDHHDRLDMLRFEGQHGMNVYYYAPKDDPYHRKLWRDPYPPELMKRLATLVDTAHANFVDFCFAISPGLSMVYSSEQDFQALTNKLASIGKLGVSCFALFLDDVPQDLQNAQDKKRFKTLAGAHAYLINKLDRHLRSQSPENHLTVTPTTYTNEWGNRDYIEELGPAVNADVDVVWTGPQVFSPAITVAQAREWGETLHRKPLVWDNFPVNDGTPWRPHLGPMHGRDANLPAAVRGLFSNPMNQARASLIPLQTISEYLWNSYAYNPARAHQRAVTSQYGKDVAELLAPFFQAYGDYFWDENIFKPLFLETRRPIDVGKIEQQIASLESSLHSLRNHQGTKELVEELSPFPPKTGERLTQVAADQAFRRLEDGRLQWREDYDALYAFRAIQPPKLDGDFSKWQGGPLYVLDRASQIFRGAKYWKGPGQFSARVALAWDDDNLCVGVDVTDPEIYQPFSGRGVDDGDVFVLTLETAFRRNFESTRADGDEYHFFFSPGNFAGVEPSVFSDEDYLPPRPQPRDYAKDIKMAWKKTATGFSGDITIPASYFEGGKFRPGYEIGVAFGAQEVFPAASGKAEAGENGKRIVLRSKTDRLFPVDFGDPSSYQRLVLIEPPK